MTGCLQGGLLFPEQLTAALSPPVGLRGFSSLFPPPSIAAVLCVPLSISASVHQWINKHLSPSLPCFLLLSQQCETEGEGSIPPDTATTGTSPLSLSLFFLAPSLFHLASSSLGSTMTLLASERSLLIRSKFRSGEDPPGGSSRASDRRKERVSLQPWHKHLQHNWQHLHQYVKVECL